MCGHHPNPVKTRPQEPVTPVLLLYEVEFCTVLQAVSGGYGKETGKSLLWATHLCFVYKGGMLKKAFLLHTVKICPWELSKKFPMTFDLGTV